MAIKSTTFKGSKITFKKKYKYVSKDFPSSPYIEAYINGKYYGTGFTKSALLKNIKRRIK